MFKSKLNKKLILLDSFVVHVFPFSLSRFKKKKQNKK